MLTCFGQRLRRQLKWLVKRLNLWRRPIIGQSDGLDCHGSRGKTLKNLEQTVNTEEKLTPALYRNCLIVLGKLPLR